LRNVGDYAMLALVDHRCSLLEAYMTASLEHSFLELCHTAYVLDLPGGSWRDSEAPMVALLMLIRQHPEERALFVRLFIDIDAGLHPAPYHLLAFCMHELRYPEIKEKILRDMEGKENSAWYRRRMNYVSMIMHAYDDDWADADMWAYYEKPNPDTSHEPA
jgi:hypothetical protein